MKYLYCYQAVSCLVISQRVVEKKILVLISKFLIQHATFYYYFFFISILYSVTTRNYLIELERYLA